ncbi:MULTISPECIES: type II/IV secretion system ATPase subunit [Haloferax]|uniref:Archaellar motor/biogenesis protein ArlI n=6 Tax=Haloferax TaxID=2251 RepID=D4GWZ0_HALVD|nr:MULTISPECIES: type II/IV secretion system ATPase subunit [Haloferax]ADE03872.1 archaellar motor/biogenesis protein ArlI [Haloferax volcanii DS2]ELK53182.1 flagella biogenesis protein FlaI [Haloferax sp. BAB-2207]ELY28098.1 flagella biogenesis protein FlaI [Haloferax volcanii DS2]ELZ73558.1 flagella biogenesis protein FlaI [Haloferax lucentense DSM 14919]ELZ93488.1 flagella biogenesis protein FlaI [Haloferax alexandrinus JCM 10717]
MATEHGSARLSDDLKRLAMQWPHLRDHLKRFRQITGEFPMLVDEPGDYESRRPNIIYPLGGPVFCQIYGNFGETTKYYTIEPEMDDDELEVFGRVKDKLLERSVSKPAPEESADYEERIEELLSEIVHIEGDDRGPLGSVAKRLDVAGIEVSQTTYDKIQYRLVRDIVGLGPLEPIMRDPENEDIHVIGPAQVDVDHGTFGLLETSVEFDSTEQFDNWLRNMGERIGDPVSDAHPIVDSTLPDGSRINIIYSDDVSLKGSSLTIRQGDDVPLSIFQITKWGTLSPELAAYLWIALENERTIFVVGETASGKTTTLNAILSFIPQDSKIYTAEDTAEVLPPHDTWQQLLTREGRGSDSEVDMFDLVAAALRSRPDYIIVGEVRGEEGRMAFQAAQTGHPVMLTFHASDIVSMIQRFTGDPINVPETFMDNCDIALFQNRVRRGNDILRRVTSVQEIEGYSKEMGGVVTREAFYWDPVQDEIVFQGMNNSFIMEQKVATLLGYDDTRKIYDDIQFRAELVRRAIQENVLGYHEVNELIEDYQRDGVEGLPFDMARV